MPKGTLKSFTTDKHIGNSIGPMGTSVDDLIMAMEVICPPNINYYDPFITPVKWDTSKIDYITNLENAK